MPQIFMLATLLLTAAATTTPQPSLPSIHDSVSVQLVNLEVIVTDSRGEPLRGLTSRDFRILEDDLPVEIAFFEFVERSRATKRGKRLAEEPPQGALATSAPAHLVVFFDDLNPGASDRIRSLTAVHELLTEELPPRSRVMLVAFDGSTRVLMPFSDDRQAIDRTFIAAARRITPRSLQGERERQRTMDLIREDFRTGPCLYGRDYARTYAEAQNHEVLQTIGAMSELVDSLAGLPGRKAFLYFGEGVPMRPGEEAYLFYLEGCGGQGAAMGMEDAQDVALMGNVKGHRPDPRMEALSSSQFDTSHRWHRLAARANGLGISLYSAISTVPGSRNFNSLENPTRGASDHVLSSIGFNQADSLSLLATDTGARLFSGANLADELSDLASDLSSYYLISYTPADPEDPRIRSIEVEIDGVEAEIRHRKSVSLKSRHEKISDRLLSQLMYGAGENRQEVEVEAIEGVGSTASIVLHIPLRNLTLLPNTGGRNGLFTAFVVARDERGRRTPIRTAAVPISIAPEGIEDAETDDFVYEVAMLLEPGDYRVAVALKDELSGEISFVGVDLDHHPTKR